MSNFKTIGQVAAYKPLYRCGMDELAVHTQRVEPSGGILFVRTADRYDKDAARQMILDLFHPERWPGHLHMLTLPSVNWRFERLLLATREEGWMRAPKPQRTFFSSVESDRAIYFAAAAQMPGTETPNRLIKQMRGDKFAFAELAVKTRYASFFFANVDDLIKEKTWSAFDAAWLDYTSPLTIERLQLIQKFFKTHIRDTLIVTALKARWNRPTSNAINAAGSHSRWLRQNLSGEILHDIEYFDTTPMAQFAVRHPIEHLGHEWRDTQPTRAEIAAVGHPCCDAQEAAAGGGTSSQNLGHQPADAHSGRAEIAAAGQLRTDAHARHAGGGTHSNDPGQKAFDTHELSAGIAAAGQSSFDAHVSYAGGGTHPDDPGQSDGDAQVPAAGIAAADHAAIDAQRTNAGGGTNQGKEQRCQNQLAAKPKKQPAKKRQQPSKRDLPRKSAKRSQRASRRRPLRHRRPRQPSAPAKPLKARANKTKRN